MQVNNLFSGLQSPINEGSSNVRTGEMVQVEIKERLDQNKATVTIKGKEFTAKFEGSIPENDRVFVDVIRFDEKGQAIIKPINLNINTNSSRNVMVSEIMLKLGLDLYSTPELKEAVQYVSNRCYSVNKEVVSNLHQFLTKAPGNTEEKLATIQSLVQRKLEITETHLSAVHSALHGKSATNILFDYLQSSNISIDQDNEQQLLNMNSNMKVQLEKPVMNEVEQEESGSNQINEANQNLDKSTIIQKDFISESSNIDAGQEQDYDTFTEIEKSMIANVAQTINLNSKNVLVTEITEKLSQLTIDFNKEKQAVLKYLEQVQRNFTENQPINPSIVKQLLESTINKLDNAILKGNYMLYSNMSTEKDLLSASSNLAKAKDLVSQGNLLEANQIVKEVKDLLNNISFKPSVTKMMHFVSEQGLLQKEMNLPKQLLAELQQTIKPLPDQDYSARQIFEAVKRLGLVHDNQIAHYVANASKGDVEPNIKSIIMRMMQQEIGQKRDVLPLNQALNNITGQQLLNKPDSSGMQNVFMQLPIQKSDTNESVKIFINSQKKGKSIDWENCNLYFVLESKSLGDIGIVVNAKNRHLSITLKNDDERFIKKADMLKEESIQRLNNIGYSVNTIQFKPFAEKSFDNKKVTEANKSISSQAYPERGYDFKV